MNIRNRIVNLDDTIYGKIILKKDVFYVDISQNDIKKLIYKNKKIN